MAIDEDTIDQLARSLFEAQKTTEPIDPPTRQYEISIEEAYEIQTRFVNYQIENGSSIVGHKIGLTNSGIQDQLGVGEPDFGHLLDAMFVAGNTVSVDELISPRVEPELGFVIDGQLNPPVSYVDVLAATDFVVPLIEVIDSRVRDWEIEIQDTIADNASSALYLLGDRRMSVDDIDLSFEGVKLYRNGSLEESGLGAAVLDHPARAVAWLANTLDNFGKEIESGQLVLSGSCTPAVDVERGDVVTAEFHSLGSVHLQVQ